jgi:hydrogenase nickel incorporation protein HypA/HybF
MHELSLAMDVIDLVNHEVDKNGVTCVEEVLIEIGDLSGVEADIFLSALQMVVKDTFLENTIIKINHTPGKGRCRSCNLEFEMKTFFDQCPDCQSFTSEIIDGKEFRVVSLVTT